MTTPNYTPGPWHFHLGRGSNPRFHIQNEGGFKIASAPAGQPWNEANAQLIALSPEMFQSLKRVVPWLGKMIADKAHLNAVAPLDAENALKEAEALIAKATA